MGVAPTEATYTCPMHPDVRQAGPGSCPTCGMALEPLATPPRTATEWVCPMHPQIVRDQPGSCPICGMALEPKTVGAEDENPELRDMSHRFWFAASLTLPLLLLTMGDMLPGGGIARLFSARTRTLLGVLLATPVCVWAAWPFYVRAVLSLRNRSLNICSRSSASGSPSLTFTASSRHSSRVSFQSASRRGPESVR